MNNAQKVRVKIISEILGDAWPNTYEKWVEDFSRNIDPETEIKVCENIAKAFLRIDRIEFLSEDQIQEALLILIWRSMESPSQALKKINLNFLSKRVAKEVLNGYEEPPSPITVQRVEGCGSSPPIDRYAIDRPHLRNPLARSDRLQAGEKWPRSSNSLA